MGANRIVDSASTGDRGTTVAESITQKEWEKIKNNLRCPECGKPARETRQRVARDHHNGIEEGALVRVRAYTCLGKPSHRFESKEIYRFSGIRIHVRKKIGHADNDANPDGVPFDLDCIAQGIRAAATKTHTADDVLRIAWRVRQHIWKNRAELCSEKPSRRVYSLESDTIGKLVLAELCQQNEAALFFRFAIVFFDMGNRRRTFRQLIDGVRFAWDKAQTSSLTRKDLATIAPRDVPEAEPVPAIGKLLRDEKPELDSKYFQNVIKKLQSGESFPREEPFDVGKLAKSLEKASVKPTNREVCIQLAREVCKTLRAKFPRGTKLHSTDIGQAVLYVLYQRNLPCMWIRFGLVYLGFERHVPITKIIRHLEQTWEKLEVRAVV